MGTTQQGTGYSQATARAASAREVSTLPPRSNRKMHFLLIFVGVWRTADRTRTSLSIWARLSARESFTPSDLAAMPDTRPTYTVQHGGVVVNQPAIVLHQGGSAKARGVRVLSDAIRQGPS